MSKTGISLVPKKGLQEIFKKKKQECIPVGCAPAAADRDATWTETLQNRDCHWTETPGQIPRERDLPEQRPPDRDPLERDPLTETPWNKNPLDKNPLDRDPPGQRPPLQRPP